MSVGKSRYCSLPRLMATIVVVLLALSSACAAPEATPTPVLPAPAAPPVAPAPLPTPTAALVPAAPTPTMLQPTPTPAKGLPTPTPVVKGKPTYGGTLRMAAALDNRSFDPHVEADTWGRPVTYSLFNTLVAYDSQFNIIPELARSWEFSPDGKTVTFRLVPGVKFQDGTPLDAEAIRWSLQRLMDPKGGFTYGSLLAPFVQSVEVVSPDTLSIRLVEAFRPLLANLGDRPGFVVPKSKAPLQPEGRVGTLVATGFSANPVGSGPFRLKEWIPGSHLRLERWDGYWEKGKPYLDGILFQEVPEDTSRLAMLRTGETDLVEVRSDNLSLVRSNPSINIIPHESGLVLVWELVVDMPPWNNKPLRQAMVYSIDRQTIVDKFLGGSGRPAYIPEGIGWAYNPDLKPVAYDPGVAKQKLAEAGYAKGVTVDIWCPSDATSIQLCEMYQSMGDAVGLHLNIKPLPVRDFTTKMLRREITSWVAGSWRPRADPDGRLRLLFHSKAARNAYHGYNNPEVDRLLDEAVKIYDTAKARSLYDQVQRLIVQDGPYIFVAYTNNYAGLNAKVRNFAWIPDFQWRLRDLWIEK